MLHFMNWHRLFLGVCQPVLQCFSAVRMSMLAQLWSDCQHQNCVASNPEQRLSLLIFTTELQPVVGSWGYSKKQMPEGIRQLWSDPNTGFETTPQHLWSKDLQACFGDNDTVNHVSLFKIIRGKRQESETHPPTIKAPRWNDREGGRGKWLGLREEQKEASVWEQNPNETGGNFKT